MTRTFVCTCNDEDKAAAREMLDGVKQRLEASNTNLLSKVVISLHVDFDAHIAEIVFTDDVWCIVTAESSDGKQFEVQCDQVEHGIAAIWLMFADDLANPR